MNYWEKFDEFYKVHIKPHLGETFNIIGREWTLQPDMNSYYFSDGDTTVFCGVYYEGVEGIPIEVSNSKGLMEYELIEAPKDFNEFIEFITEWMEERREMFNGNNIKGNSSKD